MSRSLQTFICTHKRHADYYVVAIKVRYIEIGGCVHSWGLFVFYFYIGSAIHNTVHVTSLWQTSTNQVQPMGIKTQVGETAAPTLLLQVGEEGWVVKQPSMIKK
jgi:hypothetical protein